MTAWVLSNIYEGGASKSFGAPPYLRIMYCYSECLFLFGGMGYVLR